MEDVLDRYNPWNRELAYGVDRLFHYPEVVSFLFRKEIQVITGIRRCGKTTLLRQCMRHLMDKGVRKSQLLFIPCDDPRLQVKTFTDVVDIIKRFQNGDKLFIFLDEIQVIPGWERYLKAMYDAEDKTKFIISGSTASFFEKDVASYLTGRHIFHKIKTMTYPEYLRLKQGGSLLDFAEWGGFPEVIKADTIRQKEILLRNYVQTVILRDISERHKLRNEKEVVSLLQALISAVGGKINKTRLSRQFPLARSTVEKYIRMSIDAFLLEEAGYFSHSRRKHVQKESKLYPADYGFSRVLNARFERGRAMECAVFHSLDNPTYWSSGNVEVDFVINNTGIQVCASDNPPARETESLIAFKKIFGAKGLLLTNRTTESTLSIEEFILNPERFLTR